MAISDFVDIDTHKVLCVKHDVAQWEKASLGVFPMDKDYGYQWVLQFSCGHKITLKKKIKEMVSANDPLFQILEAGSIDALSAYMIETEEQSLTTPIEHEEAG